MPVGRKYVMSAVLSAAGISPANRRALDPIGNLHRRRRAGEQRRQVDRRAADAVVGELNAKFQRGSGSPPQYSNYCG